jgi:tetratricopeptide (TPR) repeat protein
MYYLIPIVLTALEKRSRLFFSNIFLQMKVVHISRKTNDPKEWLEKANAHERNDELNEAAEAYKKAIGENPNQELPYQRLMIIYRKQKEYRKELEIIRAGIKAFEELYRSSLKVTYSKKIEQLSRALMKSTGLTDRKGQQLYDREPVGSWRRRKTLVENKLKK